MLKSVSLAATAVMAFAMVMTAPSVDHRGNVQVPQAQAGKLFKKLKKAAKKVGAGIKKAAKKVAGVGKRVVKRAANGVKTAGRKLRRVGSKMIARGVPPNQVPRPN